MIHLRCPGCKRVMTVDDSKAGKIGRCLQCNQKFQVPANIPQPPERSPRQSVSSRPDPGTVHRSLESRLQSARRPDPPPFAEDDESESGGSYGLADHGPPPLVKKKPPPQEFDEDEDFEDEDDD